MNRGLRFGGWLLLLVVVAAGSNIKRDERVVFFPSIGARSADGTAWELEIHGWIYEPERRALTLALLRKILGIGDDLTGEEKRIFRERASAFLVDNERGKRPSVRLGNQQFELPRSADNGHMTGHMSLPDGEALRAATRNGSIAKLPFRAVTRRNDERRFNGEIHLLEPTGISVISDIDDTIKISEVNDKQALLRNTFTKAFEPVPGMAEVYRDWSSRVNARFHYVSASPWQLFLPLAEFVSANGFPEGTFHLKPFRVKDESFFDLFESPEHYKRTVIEPLLKRFPKRQFILVGDCGERDPEIYGELARKHPEQVMKVLIRDVNGEDAKAARYLKAFRDISRERWVIFRKSDEVKDAVLPKD
jgi:hypothetical protein